MRAGIDPWVAVLIKVEDLRITDLRLGWIPSRVKTLIMEE